MGCKGVQEGARGNATARTSARRRTHAAGRVTRNAHARTARARRGRAAAHAHGRPARSTVSRSASDAARRACGHATHARHARHAPPTRTRRAYMPTRPCAARAHGRSAAALLLG